jgi:hypothetical protein
MEDDHNLLENGRRPQIFGIWNNLTMFANGREHQYKVNQINSFLGGMGPKICNKLALNFHRITAI